MSRPVAPPPPPPPPLIERPELVGRPRRLGYTLFTLIAWAVWVYLWLPLISLLAWLVGIQLFRQEVLQAPALVRSFYALGWFLGAVLVAALVYTGWAQYNLRRFRGKDRRRGEPDLSISAAAAFFDLPPARLEELRRASRAVIRMDDHGHPAEIATGVEETAIPPPYSTTGEG